MAYINSDLISAGKPILPIDRIKLMSPDDWEALIEEWLETKDTYSLKNIERLGGSGDLGVDVIAYISDPKTNPNNYEWDCYQCKRYSDPLSPSSMWVEFGKVIYYSYNNDYTVPNNYYLIGTNGIGTKLKKYLQDSKKLKDELKKQWNSKCENAITDTKSIPLEGKLLEYFEKFNFNIFSKIEPKIIVEEHSKHKNHLIRFGGNLPKREELSIPEIKQDEELRYIQQLLKAYNTEIEDKIETVQDIVTTKYNRHFNDTRKSFYKAEELRVLTRDNLPDEIFDNLKEDVYDGIINTYEDEHDNSFKKVKSVENEASKLVIDSNPLKEVCRPIDKKGLCHHLVNDNKISWVEDE